MTADEHHPSACILHPAQTDTLQGVPTNDSRGRSTLMRAIVISRYPVCREGLAALVGAMVTPGEVERYCGLDAALAATRSKAADLVVLDLSSGDHELTNIKAAVNALAPAPLVLLAMLEPAEIRAARAGGVKGCVPKTSAPELVTAALKLILAGGIYFSELTDPKAGGEPSLRSRLSTRQLEVLKLIEIGQTNKEIATALGISVATVKLHVQAILNITGARNRTEAALRARGQIE